MTTLIWASFALTETGQPVQTDYALCVEGNRITAAGSYADLRARYPEATQVGGHDFFMLPAMTNSHDHGRGLGTLPLGVPDDLLEIWLPGLYSQPGIDRYLLARYEGQLLLRAGVGTTAHSHNPRDWLNMGVEAEATIRGYREAGIRVAFHPPITDQNPLIYAERERFLAGLPSTLQEAAQRFLRPTPLTQQDYFTLCEQLFQQHHDATDHTVHIQVSPAGGQWCSDEVTLAAVDWAKRHNTRIQMHMLETGYQRIYAFKRWGKSFIAHLAEIGVLGPWLTLAHMVWIDATDLPLLAEHGVGVAHNPSSNLRLRSGVAPLPALLEHGIHVGVGLDGQALDDDQDYLRELRLAWTLANRPGADSPTISADLVLQMGTRDGCAITLGSDVPLGRLTPGALADLVLLDWPGVQGVWSSPETPPLDLLLRRASRQQVKHVLVNGEWVVRDGQSTRIDEAEVMSAIRADLKRYDPALLAQSGAAAKALGPYLRRFYATWETDTAPARHFIAA
ncbi:MAG: amidohydrolase family protein [Chloroflexi bacterium]|nr:amidohydrolase family protein [Chloroflexota bacterium]